MASGVGGAKPPVMPVGGEYEQTVLRGEQTFLQPEGVFAGSHDDGR
jgi:hypothetical protein